MAYDLPGFVTALQTLLDNQNARAAAFLLQATVDQLGELSATRMLDMEGTFSFATTAQQAEYTVSYLNFPKDLKEVDTLYNPLVPGSTMGIPIERVTINEIRQWPFRVAPSLFPIYWTWHHNSVILTPPPSSNITLNADYFKDARFDTNGNLITTASGTGTTNPWFARGVRVLRAQVLTDYHNTISKDEQAAQLQQEVAADGLARLEKELRQAKGASAQAPRYFGVGASPWLWGAR
jgi:hypothetical protein